MLMQHEDGGAQELVQEPSVQSSLHGCVPSHPRKVQDIVPPGSEHSHAGSAQSLQEHSSVQTRVPAHEP